MPRRFVREEEARDESMVSARIKASNGRILKCQWHVKNPTLRYVAPKLRRDTTWSDSSRRISVFSAAIATERTPGMYGGTSRRPSTARRGEQGAGRRKSTAATSRNESTDRRKPPRHEKTHGCVHRCASARTHVRARAYAFANLAAHF